MTGKQQITVEDYIAHGGSAWPFVWDSLAASYRKRGVILDFAEVERRIARLKPHPTETEGRV